MLQVNAKLMQEWFPKHLLVPSDYFTNYILVIATVTKVIHALRDYLLKYFITLQSHMSTEYEVQIRNGTITDDGKNVLKTLYGDYCVFQYKPNIKAILQPWLSVLCGQPLQPPVSEALSRVLPHIVSLVETKIQYAQQRMLSHRRELTNSLCREKCQTGPTIHNLTSIDIPKEVMDLIGTGLHVVPTNYHDYDSARQTIVKDLRTAAISHFRSTMGYYPYGVDNMHKLDSVLQHLSMLTPCGSPHSEFYYKLRDICDVELEVFINSLRFEAELLKPTDIVKTHLPPEVIITNTDKNLGVALVPVQWFKKTYDDQCEKGGYIPVDMSENQCIDLLKNKIQDLWDKCTPFQTKALRNVWPKYHRKEYKIGVMKVVPKVHKLSTIDKDSWKKLTSRPIRGAENCPLNLPSKVLLLHMCINLQY